MTGKYQPIYLCTRSNTHILYTSSNTTAHRTVTTACSAVPRVNANSSYRMSLIGPLAYRFGGEHLLVPEHRVPRGVGSFDISVIHFVDNPGHAQCLAPVDRRDVRVRLGAQDQSHVELSFNERKYILLTRGSL